MCFFFQAEDGIRDLTVTGVQTCALPICLRSSAPRLRINRWRSSDMEESALLRSMTSGSRSEERRVGKECRSRWWRGRGKKKVRYEGRLGEVRKAGVSVSSRRGHDRQSSY